MNTISTESVSQVWNDQDEQFFRITAAVFTTEFCYGASVLLASYDEEPGSQAATPSSGSAGASALPDAVTSPNNCSPRPA